MTGFLSFCGRKSGQLSVSIARAPNNNGHIEQRKLPPESSPAVFPPLQHSSDTSSKKWLLYSPRK